MTTYQLVESTHFRGPRATENRVLAQCEADDQPYYFEHDDVQHAILDITSTCERMEHESIGDIDGIELLAVTIAGDGHSWKWFESLYDASAPVYYHLTVPLPRGWAVKTFDVAPLAPPIVEQMSKAFMELLWWPSITLTVADLSRYCLPRAEVMTDSLIPWVDLHDNYAIAVCGSVRWTVPDTLSEIHECTVLQRGADGGPAQWDEESFPSFQVLWAPATLDEDRSCFRCWWVHPECLDDAIACFRELEAGADPRTWGVGGWTIARDTEALTAEDILEILLEVSA